MFSVGSIIILGTILLGPFLQNAVQTHNRFYSNTTMGDPNAVLAVSNRYEYPGVQPNETVTDIGMMSAIQAGWASFPNSPSNTESLPWYLCPTTNCAWENYSTIGVAPRCRKADTRVVRKPGLLEYGISEAGNVATSFTTSLFNDPVYARLAMSVNESIPENSSFKGEEPTLAVLAHVGAIALYNQEYYAAECLVYWVGFSNGRFVVNATGTFKSTSEYLLHNNRTLFDIRSRPNDDVHLAEPSTCTFNGTVRPCNYTIQRSAHRGLQQLLTLFLNMASGWTPDGPIQKLRELDFSNPKAEMFWSSLVDQFELGVDEPLVETMFIFLDRVAQFTTNRIRAASNASEFGEARTLGAFFQMRIIYAIYPGVFLLFSLIFLVATAWRTRKEELWKNSQAAVLYHGFSDNGPRDEVPILTVAEMERAAKATYARLEDDGTRVKLKIMG